MNQQHATYFDCQLIAGLAVEYQGRNLPGVQLPAGAAVGAVGVVEWDLAAARWAFTPYLDQSLRRCSELDSAQALGWTNARRPGGWTAPRGLVPGADGRWIADETELITVAIPPEFFDMCRGFRVSVETAIRAFIADSCGIKSAPSDPRADGYTHTSETATAAAASYLNSVFCPGPEVIYICTGEDEDVFDEDTFPLVAIE